MLFKKKGRLLLFLIIWSFFSNKSYPLPENYLQKDQQYNKLQTQLLETAQKSRLVGNEINRTEKRLKDLDFFQQQTNKKLGYQKIQLKNIITAIQKISRRGPDALARASRSADELIRSALLLRALVQSLSTQHQFLKKEVLNLQNIKNSIQEEKRSLEKMHQQQEKRHVDIEKLLIHRKRFLHQEFEKNKKIEQRINTLAQKASTIHDLIKNLPDSKSLTSRPAHYLQPHEKIEEGGDLKAYDLDPVSGSLMVQFGQITSDNSDGSGIVYEAKPASRVFSPVNGQIVFSGPFRRYNNIIIIAHDKIYHTLLSGMNRIDVEVGQFVSSGEPIGLLPNQNTREKLYLELRKNGKPINPKEKI